MAPISTVIPTPARWFLARNRTKLGPFTLHQLREMATSGQLQPDEMLLEEGQQKWRPAREVEGLFPVAMPVAAPADPACNLEASDVWRGDAGRRLRLLAWCIVPATVACLVVGALVALAIRSAGQGDKNMRPSEQEAYAKLRYSLESWQRDRSLSELRKETSGINFFDGGQAAGCGLKAFSIKRMTQLEPVLYVYHFEVELDLGSDIPALNGKAVKTFKVMRFRDGRWSIEGEEPRADNLRPQPQKPEEEVIEKGRILPTEEELRNKLKGLTSEAVTTLLGEPDHQRNELRGLQIPGAGWSATVYVYHKKDLAFSAPTGRIPDDVFVVVDRDKGTVALVEYSIYSSSRKYDPERRLILAPRKK